MSVLVRHAKPSDAKALVELARAVGSEPEGWLITDGTWRTVGGERRYLRLVRRSPDVAVLVAERDGRVVGRLSVVRDGHPASAHVADVGLMVARQHRGRGVGRALLEAAEQWARLAGVRKLELHVFPHNEAAQRLYEAAGFVREGYRSGHFRRGGQLIDAVLMAKQVDGGDDRASLRP